MRTLGRKIIVHRGETFVLTRKVFKDDGVTPFVLAKSITNPYLIITVSSNTFRVDGKYRLNSWLDLSTYPSFRSQTPVYVEDTVITNNTPPSAPDNDGCGSIYYTQDTEGNKEYYYWYVTQWSDDEEPKPLAGEYRNYSFVFHKQFLNVHTRDWIESQYQYEFRLVGGQKTQPLLLDTYKSIYPTRMWVPSDARTLYEEVKKCRPDLVKNIRWSAPLANFFTEDILQRPELLIIKPNC